MAIEHLLDFEMIQNPHGSRMVVVGTPYPSEKWWSEWKSVGMMKISQMWMETSSSYVPNHQAVYIYIYVICIILTIYHHDFTNPPTNHSWTSHLHPGSVSFGPHTISPSKIWPQLDPQNHSFQYLSGWWLSLPLWKIWFRQLGWWNSQYMEK